MSKDNFIGGIVLFFFWVLITVASGIVLGLTKYYFNW